MAKILVIGSNRGIGLEITRQLAERGDEVVAACRRSSEALDALEGVRVVTGIDTTKPESVDGLVAELGEGSLDGLLLVAGIMEHNGLDDLDLASIRRQFEVNAVGPLVATSRLAACLRPGARIGLLSSRMGSITDNTSGGGYGYRMSKVALNMAGRSLAHDLKEKAIALVLLHPGWVQTELTQGAGNATAAESASGLIARYDALTLETTGRFLHANGEELSW